MSNNKKPTVLCSEIEATRLSFTSFDENERSKGQKIAYPRYNHPKLGEGSGLILQGEWLEMTQYGVPTIGDYYKEDKDRSFLKVPLDLSKQEVVDMIKPLKDMDTQFSSDEFKKEMFGKYASKYSYQPIIRYPPSDEEEEQTKLPYMKLKLSTSWPDGAVTTKVYLNEKLEDNNIKRTPINVETVSEFASSVKYLSRFRPIFTPVKMWGQQHKMPDPKYGIVFKLIAVEVEPSKTASSFQNYEAVDLFLDNDDNNVVTTTIKTSTLKSAEDNTVKDENNMKLKSADKPEINSDSDSDSSSDSSSDSDSDSEEPVKVKQPVKSKEKLTKADVKKKSSTSSA